MRRFLFALVILIFPVLSSAADPNIWWPMSNGHHSLRKLGSQFIVNVPVKHVEGARLVLFNERVAKDLGLVLPSDPKELEKLILQNFAFVVSEYLDVGGREWFATYYQDSVIKAKGAPRGDGRALWAGELTVQSDEAESSIDVVVKGTLPTPLAATIHNDPSKIDGLQSMREAVHSFMMSEANYRNQLNTTVDIAVIEIPLLKKDHNGRVEKAAITVRLGEQTRIAHPRFWSDRPQDFQKIFDYSARRLLHLPQGTILKNSDRQKYFVKLAKNLADEAARYYDLHAVHGSPTAGNRTTSGATVDLGTFRYLDAHHSRYSYLSGKTTLGGAHGQTAQMSSYLDNLESFAATAGLTLDLDNALAIFDSEFKAKLTELWLNRLGLDESMQKTLSPATREAIYKLFTQIHETSARNMIQFGSRLMAPAGFEPRRVFANALALLQAPPEQRFGLAIRALSTDRSWSQTPPPSRGIVQAWLSGNKDFELTRIQNEFARELSRVVERINEDVPSLKAKLSEATARASAINGAVRLELGKELGQERAAPILAAIQSGQETYVEISQRAIQAAQTYVDPGLKLNPVTNLGKKKPAASVCADVFARGA